MTYNSDGSSNCYKQRYKNSHADLRGDSLRRVRTNKGSSHRQHFRRRESNDPYYMQIRDSTAPTTHGLSEITKQLTIREGWLPAVGQISVAECQTEKL